MLLMSACWNISKKANNNTKKNMPTLRISPSIGLLMINAPSFHCSLKYAQFPILFTCSLPRLRGLSFITSFEGGNDANAIAPNVSIMRLIQSI